MIVKGVIFDLDGTLVNSIHDISDSMNAVLKNGNYPTHSYSTYETFIGGGIRDLVSKSLPSSSDETKISVYFSAMLAQYKKNCTNKTYVYKEIPELIKTLIEKKLKLAVLSNKADALTKKVVQKKLPSLFAEVHGMTTEVLKKPNPKVVLSICKKLHLNPKETMYVGDTAVDIKTAKNAGMISVAVTWGFRSKASLMCLDPDFSIDSPKELLELL